MKTSRFMLPEGTKEDLEPIHGDYMRFSSKFPLDLTHGLDVTWPRSVLPSGYLTVCHGIDDPFIDGLPINSMVDLSMAIYVK